MYFISIYLLLSVYVLFTLKKDMLQRHSRIVFPSQNIVSGSARNSGINY